MLNMNVNTDEDVNVFISDLQIKCKLRFIY